MGGNYEYNRKQNTRKSYDINDIPKVEFKNKEMYFLSFEDAIRRSPKVHDVFHNHKCSRKIAGQILDESGELKAFYKFFRDVEPLINGYDKDLLEKEYCLAIQRAHLVGEWQQFEQEKDIFPNLLWVPSVSPNGCKPHKKYWNKIWSIDDPFFKQHYPGDCLDCQCDLRATDMPTTGFSPSK
jgi:hypothetical protein